MCVKVTKDHIKPMAAYGGL